MTAPPPPPGAALVANLVGQIAFGLLAMTICLPSMPSWSATFGASPAAVQLTFSGYLLAYGLAQLVHGPLSDRLGRRRVLIAGLALAGLGSLAAAFAPGLGSLIAARVLQGAGAGAGMVVGRAIVQDRFVGHQRTRVMAYVGMALGVCPPLATLVGGQLHVQFGWRAGFLLMATMAVLMMLAAWRGLPAHPSTTTAAPPPGLRDLLASYARLLREARFLRYVGVLALTNAAFFAFLGGAPRVLTSYGVGPERIGWFVMCVTFSYVAGNFLTSRLIQRLGEARLLAMGQLASAAGIGLVLALALAGLTTPLALALPLVLMGIGHGFVMPTLLTGTVGLMPALAGAAAAVAGTSQQLVGALSGWLVGLVPHDTALPLALLMLAFTASAAAVQAGLRR